MESSLEELTVEKLKRQFEEFDDTTRSARLSSENCRDYRDLKQWSADEIAELKRRKQAPLVIPKVPAKVDFLVGMERQQRTDPRAYPRTLADEPSADAVTDALRYVADNVDFDQIASDVFEQGLIVEGYAGAIVEPVMVREQVEIAVNFIPFDRCYFDPHSRERDFSDCTYKGLVVWMDLSEAKLQYPDKADRISELQASYSAGDTFEDKPRWVDNRRKRIKVCQHYFLHGGEWHVAHFTGELFLLDPQPSPLLDEHGAPDCPIELVHGYITRDNERYGLVLSMLGLQDEINHRRSKALHSLSSKQVLYEQGVLPNPRKTVNELKKADGAVEVPQGSLENNRIQIRENADVGMSQFQLLQEAKSEMDARGASSILNGLSGEGVELSGRALRTIQNNAQLEIGPLMDAHRHWKRRCYRQMWNRIKQFWDNERWVRVTDDEDNLKWVGLNQPVTVGERLQEKAREGDERAQAALQQMLAIQDPKLNQVYETRNKVAEIDVDIHIDEAPDAVTVQQEQFETIAELAKMYGPQHVPFEVVLQLSSLRNKDKVLEKIKGDPQQAEMAAQVQDMQQQIQQLAAQLNLEDLKAKIENTQADTATKVAEAEKKRQETQQTIIENTVAARYPDTRPNFNI
ncbi:hypothetical protein [Microbulbifer sp. 2205BS26-8]|uniref:portal protein n=1 Tax=Microbulbifer sp. 2205BS26-8 TaxID=3064386 RepID=UPI00273F3F2D|nr:hypothetical protein [Microbulbifer sp. 2205BS26-8]MDP5211216.1 hypothetical protein [Microbulbifer sp. 2205BS26-8]